MRSELYWCHILTLLLYDLLPLHSITPSLEILGLKLGLIGYRYITISLNYLASSYGSSNHHRSPSIRGRKLCCSFHTAEK